MSIRKMIALHPDVAGHVNQPLGDAAHHLMYCARMCLSCADACAAEKMDMRQCIRTCLDCSDICEATGKLAVRRTGANEQVLREMLELCARVCDACAAECEKHDHEHCKLCAQMCRECAADCRNAAASNRRLEVGLSEARNALVDARRVEHAEHRAPPARRSSGARVVWSARSSSVSGWTSARRPERFDRRNDRRAAQPRRKCTSYCGIGCGPTPRSVIWPTNRISPG